MMAGPGTGPDGPSGRRRMTSSRKAAGRVKLLAECEVTTFRASGPGGQHRNRRESAVRLRHLPTGIVVVATERRSQHQNRAVALERLERKLALRRRTRKRRLATGPTAASARRRIQEKKHHGAIKAARAAPGRADDAG